MRASRGLLLVLLLTTSALLSGCWGGSDANVGDVLDALGGTSDTTLSTVRIPSGEIQVVLDAPVSHLERTATVEGVTDANDNSFVPVQVKFLEGAGVPDGSGLDVVKHETLAGLTLVTDDHETGLPMPQNANPEELYVVVPGHPDDVRLDVQYDGVTQSVSLDGKVDQGDASALYHPHERVDFDCDGPLIPAISEPVSCGGDAMGMAYIDSVGWAPPGKLWTLVRLEMELGPRARVTNFPERVTTKITGQKDQSTVAGQPPQFTYPLLPDSPPYFDQRFVFPATADESQWFVVDKTFTGAQLFSAPRTNTFRFHASVNLRW